MSTFDGVLIGIVTSSQTAEWDSQVRRAVISGASADIGKQKCPVGYRSS